MKDDDKVERVAEAIAGHFRQCEIDVFEHGDDWSIRIPDTSNRPNYIYLLALADTAIEAMEDMGELTFADAVRIARGCTDYGGGYVGNNEHYEIFQHGIGTVIRVLESARENGLSDRQIAVLHSIGSNETKS